MEDKEKYRKEFLIAMYKELFNNIDRHISFSWQSIGVFATFGFAILMTERFDVHAFISIMLIYVVVVWMLARLIDANHWYERNIHIISNIEKEFLNDDDSEKIHFYFKGKRSKKNQLESIEIQSLGLKLTWIISLFYYVYKIDECSMVLGYVSVIPLLILTYITSKLLNCYKDYNYSQIVKLRNLSPGGNEKAKELEDDVDESSKICSRVFSYFIKRD